MKEWLITDEDLKAAFLHDCRIYNGGAVASKREQKMWNKKPPKVKQYDGPIFIDRLRE